jgi:hypothetical protein
MFWDPDPDFFPHPGSGSWGQKSTGSRIRNRNTASIRGKSYKMPRVHFTGSPLGRPRRSTWRWVSPQQWRPPAYSGISSSQSPRLSHPKHMHIIVLSAKFWSPCTATQCLGSGSVLFYCVPDAKARKWATRIRIAPICFKQCCGSGSGGSVCFWASGIR